MEIDITTIIVAVIGSGIINTLLNAWLSSRKKDDSIQRSLRLLMKDRLRSLCMYYVNQGWIYEDELEDLMVMHTCYHDNLNGNGYLDELIKRVKNLEIRGTGVK